MRNIHINISLDYFRVFISVNIEQEKVKCVNNQDRFYRFIATSFTRYRLVVSVRFEFLVYVTYYHCGDRARDRL